MRVVSFAAPVVGAIALAAVLAVAGDAVAQESDLATLRAATRAAPGDPAADLALGRALRRAGHLAEASTALHQGRNLSGSPPGAVRADWELVRLQADRHDFNQANLVCKDIATVSGASAASLAAMVTTTWSPEAHACLAYAQLIRQRATEALEETRLALAKDPGCYEAKLAEGRAYALQLDAGKAEASLHAAIALRPAGVEPFVELGRALEREGRHDDAMAELRAAVQLDPRGPDALFALASVLPPGAGQERVDLLRRATDERPSFLEAWLALAQAHFDAGRLGDAKTAAGVALQVDATSAPANVLLGRVALHDGNADEAIQDGKAALKVMANSAAATLLVADGQAHKGEVDLALESYQAAWGMDHGDPTPLVHASEACHAASRDTSARAFGVKATQEFPRWGPAWAALGDALAGQNEKAVARDAYRKALAGDGLVNPSGVQAKLAALQ